MILLENSCIYWIVKSRQMTASEGERDDRRPCNKVSDARPELNRRGRHCLSFKMYILDALRAKNV